MVQALIFLLSIGLAGSLAATAGASAELRQLGPAPGSSATNPVGAFLLLFDENGNAVITINDGPPTPLFGSLLADPASGCPTCLALTYLLPESVATGDVEIFDPPSEGGGTSDWLRFTDAAGDISGDPAGDGVRMIYYSLAGPDDTALADVPFPDNIGSQNAVFGPTETVSGGVSTFDYQPAGVPFPEDNEYIGISDEEAPPAIPEPASLTLLCGGLAAMGLIVRRRRRGADDKGPGGIAPARTLCGDRSQLGGIGGSTFASVRGTSAQRGSGVIAPALVMPGLFAWCHAQFAAPRGSS